MNEKQTAALEAFDGLNQQNCTIRECYNRMPAVRLQIEEAFSSEQIPITPTTVTTDTEPVPPPTRLYQTGTHTFATLLVSESTFNDVYSRISSAYRHSPADAEHYFQRDDKKVVRIVLGEIALVRE